METKHRIMEIIDSNKETMTDADYLSCSNWLMRVDPEAHASGGHQRPGDQEVIRIFLHGQRTPPPPATLAPEGTLYDRQQELKVHSIISNVFFLLTLSSALTISAREHSKELSIYLLVFLGLVFMIAEFSRCICLFC